jgi:small subunit ribosomal protein S9
MAATKSKQYIEAVGRRKTSTARVRITESSKISYVINDKALEDYFPVTDINKRIQDVFTKGKIEQAFDVSVKVSGGGVSSQADAVKLGLARAILKFDEDKKGDLKALGYLKRDPRAKERRKAGMAGKARKKKQWSKR